MRGLEALTRQVVPVATDVEIGDGFDIETVTAIDVVFAAMAPIGGFILSRLAKRAVRTVKREFEAGGIVIAFPQRVLWNAAGTD